LIVLIQLLFVAADTAGHVKNGPPCPAGAYPHGPPCPAGTYSLVKGIMGEA